MPTYTLQIPQVGLLNSTEDPKIASSLTTVQTALNAGLDTSNLSPSAAIVASQMAAGVVRFSTIVVSTSATLTDGQAATCSPGATVTLPSATAGNWCAVVPGSTVTGASPVTINRAGSDVIYTNSSTASVTSVTQGAPLGSLIFYAYASGSWVLLAGTADTGWVTLTLTTNWTVIAGGYAPAYRIVGNQVLFRGGTTNGTGSSSVQPFPTPLPAAIRPASSVAVAWNYFQPLGAAFFNLANIGSGGAWSLTNSVPNGDDVVLDGTGYSLF